MLLWRLEYKGDLPLLLSSSPYCTSLSSNLFNIKTFLCSLGICVTEIQLLFKSEEQEKIISFFCL